jgi:hypothetical protein
MFPDCLQMPPFMDTNPIYRSHGEPVDIPIPEMLGDRFKEESRLCGLSEKEVAALAIQRGLSVLELLGEPSLD